MTRKVLPFLLTDALVLEAIQRIRCIWPDDATRLRKFRLLKIYTEQYHPNPGLDGTGVLTDVRACIDELEIKAGA